VAGSKRKRESNRRDFTGASSGCWARTAERVLHRKRRLKAAVGAQERLERCHLLRELNGPIGFGTIRATAEEPGTSRAGLAYLELQGGTIHVLRPMWHSP
jgi:hypothetical protein